MKILIIGGTGLISTSITRLLLEQKADVTLFNRGQSKSRFPTGAKQITGDRRDFAAFERLVREASPFDCAIDMICYRPDEAECDVRVFGAHTKQFIFCSTIDVYAKPARRYPYRDDEPHEGLGDYALNKVRCEAIFAQAQRAGALNVTTIRPAWTYGEGRGLLFPFGGDVTLTRMSCGKPIVVHGDGTSLWVGCHADDVAGAFVKAIGNARAFGKSYHATGEEPLTWDQYYRVVAEALGAPPPRLVHIPSELLARVAPERAAWCEINFKYCNIFDNSAARTDLGFRYTIPLLEGARRVIGSLREQGRIPASDNDPEYERVLAEWQRLRAAMERAFCGSKPELRPRDL